MSMPDLLETASCLAAGAGIVSMCMGVSSLAAGAMSPPPNAPPMPADLVELEQVLQRRIHRFEQALAAVAAAGFDGADPKDIALVAAAAESVRRESEHRPPGDLHVNDAETLLRLLRKQGYVVIDGYPYVSCLRILESLPTIAADSWEGA